MSNAVARTITALYIGLSAIAVFFLMHAALTDRQLATTAASSGTTTRVSQQSGTNTPTTSTPGASSGSNTSSGSSTGQSSSGSGNLTSQQYDETSNWAGYATTAGVFSGISGSWKVPVASGSDETAADATWIGIGGISSNDLIQVGTQNIVSPDGQVSTSAFYELLPDASEDITTLTVNPGDTVSASLSEISTGEWRITLNDTTTGDTFSTTVAYGSSESSAEWIEEDPSDGNDQQIPLDSFGTVDFTGGTVVDNGSTDSITASGAKSVSMVNSEEQSLASVSSLSTNGENFSVTRTSAASGVAVTEFDNDPGGWVRRGSGMGFGGGYSNGGFGGGYTDEGY
jgi:hypothetical protein